MERALTRARSNCGPDACDPLRCAPRAAANAFTLIELLVATAVVMVFLVLAVNMSTDTLRQSEAVNAKLKANLQARLVMDWITRDIQTALVRKDGGEWLRMVPSTLDAGISLPVCRLMLFSQAGETHISGNSTLSGPAAILYDVDYRDPTSRSATPASTALFRMALDPGETFTVGFVENTPVNLQTELWKVVLPNGARDIEPENLLIQNIAGFQIAFEFLAADGTTHKSEATQTFSAGVDGKVRVGTGGGATEYPAARVLAAEITLWLLDPSGVRALQQGNLSQQEFFTRHARPYMRKIEIASQ